MSALRKLLDTHNLLWVVRNADELSAAARAMIEHADEVYVSSVSLYEAAIKFAAGKLPLRGAVRAA